MQGIRDALKIMGIVETTAKDTSMPEASWNFYEMFQAFIQVIRNCVLCHCIVLTVMVAPIKSISAVGS